MKILVTGAAEYIGSVVRKQLIAEGHEVVAFDNLSHGHAAEIDPQAEFVQGDLLDGELLTQVLIERAPDAVVHLAAEALIDASLRDPGLFFCVNVCGGLNLLEAMVAAGVKRMVFSSTAAGYGEPKRVPIMEDDDRIPVNAYGESKLAFERMLEWYRKSYGLKHVSLRYFNACGATRDHGEFRDSETHIIPILFEAALGQRETIRLFGTDYDTPDGTCVRDYIHVADIARAHLLALKHVDRIEAAAYNMGNGAGYSNRQVIDTVSRITGREIAVIPGPRRPGDPARLVASAARLRQDLGWEPQYPDLETMVQTAWDWRQRHPKGYTS